MYIPKANEEVRVPVLHELIEAHPFTTLVTLGSAGLFASHIPMVLHRDDSTLGTLRGHLSRANAQWRDFSPTVDALAIFTRGEDGELELAAAQGFGETPRGVLELQTLPRVRGHLDEIAVNGIRVWGRHGADPGERDALQPIDVAFAIRGDVHASARSDDLHDTISYFDLHAAVVAVVRDRQFALLERLGAAILDVLFDEPRIAFASVALAKPAKLDGATPSVTVTRSRG